MVGAIFAGTVLAEEGQRTLLQPGSIYRVAFDYDDYLYFAPQGGESVSSSDAPEAAEELPSTNAYCDVGCDSASDSDCSRQRSCRGGDIDIGGWISAGIFANAYGATNNGPLGFNDVGDGFTFNQAWIYAERVADTGGFGVDWGFRVDYVFGVDGPDVQAFGSPAGSFDNPWDTSRDYGSALPQLYGEIALNNLSVKLGHFARIIGWEVADAPDNFFYTHAYTMYYGEPFSHTGVLASYAVDDDVTVHAGWTQGWDTGFDNTFRADTFLGGVSLPVGENATFTWVVSAGDLGAAAGDLYMSSIVFEYAVTDNLTYILQHDLGSISGVGAGNHDWYGINQYIQYQINDCWAAGMRIEWFCDEDGLRVPTPVGGFGNAGSYYEVTWGFNYKPRENVIIRPEIRYDWYHGSLGSGAQAFNAGADSEQFSGGLDFIVTF